MSKILELAEEIDKELSEMEKKIANLASYASDLESELNKEKEKGVRFRKGLIELLAKYSNEDWHTW
jgi:prefoldin subunit 5